MVVWRKSLFLITKNKGFRLEFKAAIVDNVIFFPRYLKEDTVLRGITISLGENTWGCKKNKAGFCQLILRPEYSPYDLHSSL